MKIITTMEGYKDLLIYPPSVLLGGNYCRHKKGRKALWNCFGKNSVYEIK